MARFNGNNNKNKLNGTASGDQIFGHGDDDELYGNNGADRIDGGDGNDLIEGGEGSDDLTGGNGNDTIRGGNSADFLGGGAGRDLLEGGGDRDLLAGGSGTDTAVFRGHSSGYSISNSGGFVVVSDINKRDGDEGADRLTEIERIQFSDKVVFLVPNKNPVAVADTAITNEDTAIAVATSVLANDTDADLDPLTVSAINGAASAIGTEIVLPSGAKLTVQADGTYLYNPNGSFDYLPANGSTTDNFTYTVSDGFGGTANWTVVVTITGINDAASITGTSTGTVVEAGGVANGTVGTPTASADLLADDIDNPDDVFQAVAAGAATTNGYGTYALTAAGVWTYTLNNNNSTVQALNVGSPALADSFTVLSQDGTSKVVNITINGANDAAAITGTATGTVVEAGGVSNGTAGTPTASADLFADDIDNPDDVFQAVAAGASTGNGYGTYAVTAAGVWTYTLNNNNSTVQALNVGSPALADSFTVLSQDGTSKVVNITINGANDAASITGTSTGTVVEAGGVANGTAGTPTASADLFADDVDNPDDAFQAVGSATASANGYGTYTLTAAGVWTYTLNNNNSTVQALNVGSPALADSFTVLSQDGTSKVVNITINGRNDAATISGTSTGTVVEAGASSGGTPTATGNLLATDVDNTFDVFQAVGSATASANGYGTYTLTAAGVWTYTLNNSNATVNALNTGSPALADSFTVLSQDGTSKVVNITINGAGDGPTGLSFLLATGTGSTVVENNAPMGAGLRIATFSATGDPDSTIFHYALSGANASRFSLNTSTGLLSVGASDIAGNDSTPSVITITGFDEANRATSAVTYRIYVGTDGNVGIIGTNDSDFIFGLAGNDGNGTTNLTGGNGNDGIVGGLGNDIIAGLAGADQLYGGDGADRFDYNNTTESPSLSGGDIIFDFDAEGTTQDTISLDDIDANQNSGGNQTFAWGGQNSNIIANGVTFFYSGGNTIIQADTDGDTSNAGLVITLLGTISLEQTNFIL